MSALTSLARLSTMDLTAAFFVTVSEEEPSISHVDALVSALEDSSPEKQYFRVLAGLARATTLLYWRGVIPVGSAHDVRSRLILLLHAYGYVLPSSSAQANWVDMTQVWRTRYSHRPH